MRSVIDALRPWVAVAADKPNPQQVAFLSKGLERFSPEAVERACYRHFEHSKFFPHLSDLLPTLDSNHERARPLPPPIGPAKQLVGRTALEFERLKELAHSGTDEQRRLRARGAQYIDGFNEFSTPALVKRAIRETVGEEIWQREADSLAAAGNTTKKGRRT